MFPEVFRGSFAIIKPSFLKLADYKIIISAVNMPDPGLIFNRPAQYNIFSGRINQVIDKSLFILCRYMLPNFKT